MVYILNYISFSAFLGIPIRGAEGVIATSASVKKRSAQRQIEYCEPLLYCLEMQAYKNQTKPHHTKPPLRNGLDLNRGAEETYYGASEGVDSLPLRAIF